MTTVAIILACISGVALFGWLRERGNARDWELVCLTLGNEYDKLIVELYEAQHPEKGQLPKAVTRWVN